MASRKKKPALQTKEDLLREQLLLLRDVFQRTGVLHEAQVLQLNYWSRGLIGHSTSVTTKVRLGGKGGKGASITFEAVVSGSRPAGLQDNLAILNSWTRWLLGEQFNVVVKCGGKVVFGGQPTRKKGRPGRRTKRA